VTKKIVVVVDDEPGFGETIQDIFEEHGFEVHVALDGIEALDLFKKLSGTPCIVILDLMMPRMDGNTLYRAMKSDPNLSKVAVLVTTSDPSRAPAGVLLMRKPIDIDVLVTTVSRCCDQPISAAS
jgi:DNA-binding response OmpR family regulator